MYRKKVRILCGYGKQEGEGGGTVQSRELHVSTTIKSHSSQMQSTQPIVYCDALPGAGEDWMDDWAILLVQ